MESHGTPGRIQITQATYELLGDAFLCEPRGTVSIKGKGDMETWYLVGLRQRPGLSQTPGTYESGAPNDPTTITPGPPGVMA